MHVDDAAFHGPAGLEAGVPEDVAHLLVLVEHVCLEAQVASPGGKARQPLEDEAADPPALVFVRDHEADLGVGAALAHIVAQAQDALLGAFAFHRQEAGPHMGIFHAELFHELAGDAGDAAHEAHGQSFLGEAPDERLDPVHVLGGGDPKIDPLTIL